MLNLCSCMTHLSPDMLKFPSLQSQLDHAVKREDYDDAARLKVAIAAAATNDAVGRVMSQLNVCNLTYCFGFARLGKGRGS